MKCSTCGKEMETRPGYSKMGEQTWRSGFEIEVCTNPRCSQFGVKR